MKDLGQLLPLPLIVFAAVLFTVSLAVEIKMNLIWARQAMDYLKERRHKRKQELLDKQIELEKAKGGPSDLPAKSFSFPTDLNPLNK